MLLPVATLLSCSILAHAQTPKPKREPQKEYLAETDPASPRKSQLEGTDTSSTQVLRVDLDKDGDPDTVERWWNGKRVRWYDENDNLRPADIMGDRSDDSLQIDRDGDGYYDGPGDMNVDYVDDEGDGRAELEVVAMNPSATQDSVRAHESHWMIFEDVDKDGVFGCINWDTFAFECWGIDPKDPNFKPDYNGDSIFLKEHLPVWAIQNPDYNWENPFAFYDFDKDGCTEMAIRYCDNKERDEAVTSETNGWKYDGTIDDAYVTWDLDNDTNRGNELDYDMTLRFEGGEKLRYDKFINMHPKLKAPEWTLKYFRENKWRQIDRLVYVPHDKCYEEIFKPKWGKVWMVFDEDDDDHRWERVELYYPERNGVRADPYLLGRYYRDQKTSFGLSSHIQSDSLGDRGEFDEDYSGGGKLYIGKWDKKVHLHGAEWGGWTVDFGGKFWGGAGPARGNASPEKAKKVEEVVQYADTNNNGFIDEIRYDYEGDRNIDLKVNLLELKGEDGKATDEAELFHPWPKKWKGMHEEYVAICEKSWQDAIELYQAAWEKGLNTPELDDFAIASSTAEKYNSAYWIKERVFRMLDKQLAGDAEKQSELRRLHFTGNTKGVADFVRKLQSAAAE